MADPCLLSDCKIWLGGYDLTGACNKVQLTAAKRDNPNGRFGDVVDAFHPGLQQIDASVGGFWSAGSVTDPDDAIWPRIDPSVAVSSWPLTFCPPTSPSTAAGADGNLAYSIQSAQFRYTLGAQHGESLPFDVVSRVKSGALYRQTIVLPKGTINATTQGTGRQLGTLGSTQKLVAVLHVFAIVGGSWVLTIESDDNAGFATAVVRATATAVTTAPNRQVLEVNGPVALDDYWRAVVTKTGGTSITAAVTLSIENQ